MNPTKACKTCNLELSIDEFPIQRDRRRGKEYRRAHCEYCWIKRPHRQAEYRRGERARHAIRSGKVYSPKVRSVRALQTMLCLEAHRAHREWLKTKGPDDEVMEHFANAPWRNPRLTTAEKYTIRVNADPEFCLAQRMRRRLRKALRGSRPYGEFQALFGYSVAQLRDHLERQFTEGMGWHNMGRWHIDHIVPVISFDQRDKARFDECWALSNLRPLWARDNLSKGSKRDRSSGPS